MSVYLNMYSNLTNSSTAYSDIECINKDEMIDITKATNDLIKIQNEVFIAASKNISASQLGDYDTSDDETAEQEHQESTLNFRSPFGMSALFSPMYALHQAVGGKQINYELDEFVYYETNVCWPKELNSKLFIKHTPNKQNNNLTIYYIDLNPCIANASSQLPAWYFAEKIKELSNRKSNVPTVLVLDTTSSRSKQVMDILTEFDKQDKIPLLVTACSVLKHNELGLDAFSVGENKVYFPGSKG